MLALHANIKYIKIQELKYIKWKYMYEIPLCDMNMWKD
jgi:hypothetical protein